MALHACRVFLKRFDPHFLRDLPRFRFAVQGRKSLVVRRLFPNTYFSRMTFITALDAKNLMSGKVHLNLRISRIRVLVIDRHPNACGDPHYRKDRKDKFVSHAGKHTSQLFASRDSGYLYWAIRTGLFALGGMLKNSPYLCKTAIGRIWLASNF